MTAGGRRCLLLGAAVALTLACGKGAPPVNAPGDPWSVTVWGEHYEIFAEVEASAAVQDPPWVVHVTVLDGFAPLAEGEVEVRFRSASGTTAGGIGHLQRPGVFRLSFPLPPAREGELEFAVRGFLGPEVVSAGAVRLAPHPDGPDDQNHDQRGEITFFKEQQWRTPFATARAAVGLLPRAVRGPALVGAAAGNEVELTSPVDGVVTARRWPFVGQQIHRGEALLAVTPRVAPERSLAELEAAVVELEGQHATASSRLRRLEALREVEAVSAREVEEARQTEGGLAARLAAARRDLAAAAAVRRGAAAEEPLPLTAPFPGRVAAVYARPGQVVAAGAALLRLVRPDPLWVTVALPVSEAARLGAGLEGLTLQLAASAPPLVFSREQVRLLSRAPAVDPQTGSLDVIVEIRDGAAELPLAARGTAELVQAEWDEGVVLPLSALVDDGGEPVVYVQHAGERFERRPVRSLRRLGERVLLEGVRPGERVVTRGGPSLRRAALLAAGAEHGHVH